ncbi:hypothetical protein L3Y34_007780 [Caenorhabditis briggsae]|nr:hypothetical protein L3Y34_007780 [Caenorhabditis briggsae]
MTSSSPKPNKTKATVAPLSESSAIAWNHKAPMDYDEKLKKYENRQRKEDEVKEIRKDRRILRRQNGLLEFHNEVLFLQNQRLASEKQNLKMERQAMAEKKNELAKNLRKQKRINEYYKRRLVEIQKLEKFAI